MVAASRAIVLLGAQRFNPTLGEAADELGVRGKIATITAGWQERETEDDDLREHLGERTINLRLHARADVIFREDPEFRDAHRARQALLRHRQDFYRIRLEHELAAQHVIRNRVAPAEILAEESRASIQSIRDLDRWHLEQCSHVRRDFEEKWKWVERDAIAKQRAELQKIIGDVDAVAIAGGHVAILLNRLELFGIADFLKGKTLFAWCAGAMALSERVILFHDTPPQGPGAAEVLDAGLGLVKGIVVLPQSEFRIKLDDTARVRTMAQRFAPSTCLGMPARSRMTVRRNRYSHVHDIVQIAVDGTHAPLAGEAA